MSTLRMMAGRILPSLPSLLLQTKIHRPWRGKAELEFRPCLLLEFVFAAHEVFRDGLADLPDRRRGYFDMIIANPDIFPGLFHVDLAGNVLPKLELLRQFGFYVAPAPAEPAESCGAHSPRVQPTELATRVRP